MDGKMARLFVITFLPSCVATATGHTSQEEALFNIEALLNLRNSKNVRETSGNNEAIKIPLSNDPVPPVESNDNYIDPIRPIPRNPMSCCHTGTTYVDLVEGGVCDINNNAVKVIEGPSTQFGYSNNCSLTALLKISFEKITRYPCNLTDGCLAGPYCGRRMLRVDLELSSQNRSGYLFDVGDSVSNNGYGGDDNHQQNDAEVHGRYPYIAAYSSDLCSHDISLRVLAYHQDAIANGLVDHVTLFVSDKHLRITNDNGLDETLCHECMFALNGQSDNQSNGPNQDIYLALNRVINNSSRESGAGVCSARVSWVCAW